MPSSCGLAHSTSCSTCGIDMKKGVPPGNLGSSQQNANLYVIEVDATSAFVVELACAYSRLQVDGGELDELRNDESADAQVPERRSSIILSNGAKDFAHGRAEGETLSDLTVPIHAVVVVITELEDERTKGALVESMTRMSGVEQQHGLCSNPPCSAWLQS